MSDIHADLEKAERAMHVVERRIASMTFWERPDPQSVNGRILAALEARRTREQPILDDLRVRAQRAPARQAAFTSGDFPIATRTTPDLSEWPEIPAFLRRAQVSP